MKKLLLTTLASLALTAQAQVNISMKIENDSLQHITGFGAAAIGTLMCPLQDDVPIKLAYGSDSPIGFNIMRIEVSPSTTPDEKTQWFDSPYDWHGFVKVVKEGRKRGSIIYACPWSPPPVLKTNNSASGGKNDNDESLSVKGKLNEKGYEKFFSWLNNFTKYMKSQDAPVDIISLQNEPDWWVGYSGCVYEPYELRDLVKKSASTFDPYTSAADKSKPIKLMSGEPLGYRHDYAEVLLSDPESRKYIDYLGGHIYGHTPYMDDNGNYGEMKKSVDIAHKYGVKEIWMTEHSVDPWVDKTMPCWDEQIQFAKEVNEVILAGGTAYVYWYLTQFWGFVGDGEKLKEGGENATNGYNTKNVILPRGYVMSHFSKYLAGSDRLKNTTLLGSSPMKEKAALQRNVFTKGDSIFIVGIVGVDKEVSLSIETPVEVESGSIITSLSNTDLCKQTPLTFDAGTKTLTVPLKGKSVNTIILKRSETTGVVEQMADEAKPRTPLMGIYTLAGTRLTCDEDELPSGIYVINGKKVSK